MPKKKRNRANDFAKILGDEIRPNLNLTPVEKEVVKKVEKPPVEKEVVKKVEEQLVEKEVAKKVENPPVEKEVVKKVEELPVEKEVVKKVEKPPVKRVKKPPVKKENHEKALFKSLKLRNEDYLKLKKVQDDFYGLPLPRIISMFCDKYFEEKESKK